ncbi:hypothetical protein [Paracidovorax avenae]|nr:hypothetical protein [Paracidovorax avenae]
MKFLINAFFSILVLYASAMGASATPVFIQSGTWIVDSELNGKPGRGMAIDIQNQHLVMQVYNYTATGQPTFHLASGPLDGMQFQAPLKQYRGGRFFGSGDRTAREEQSPGDVRIRFESSTTGFIQFPGEPEVAMSRLKFDEAPQGSLLKPNFRESWIVAEFDERYPLKPMRKIEIYRDPNNGNKESLQVIGSHAYESTFQSSAPCSAMEADGWIRCDATFDSVPPEKAVFEIRRSLNGLEGFITRQDAPGRRNKLRGSKYSNFNQSNFTSYRMANIGEDRITDYRGVIYENGIDVYTPEPGTWVISQELNGTPGRGMAIDVQNDVLVMQVFNYESNGDPTFHLAVGKMKYGTSNVVTQLKRYAGGRYFGGPPLTGHEAADSGKVELAFDSTLAGWVKFPGEDWLAIEKFQFGYGKKNPEALLGEWSFGAFDDWDYGVTLDRVEGNEAKGRNASCHYTEGRTNPYLEYNGTILCTLYVFGSGSTTFQAVSFDATSEIRGVPAMSRTVDKPDLYRWRRGFAMQIRDKNGTPVGLGQLPKTGGNAD